MANLNSEVEKKLYEALQKMNSVLKTENKDFSVKLHVLPTKIKPYIATNLPLPDELCFVDIDLGQTAEQLELEERYQRVEAARIAKTHPRRRC